MDCLDQMGLKLKTNILLIRRGAIGDVIMTTAAVQEVAQRYHSRIDVCTDHPEVFLNNPYVENVISFDDQYADKLLDSYQAIFDLDDAYEINPTQNYLASFLNRVGAFGCNTLPSLYPSEDDHVKVLRLLEGIGEHIVVHMRNWHWGAKNISMDVWFDIFTKLFEVAPTCTVLVVGSSTDHFIEHPSFVDLRNKLTLQEMHVLCKESACFVGIDSAPFHVAATSGCFMVGLLTHLRPEVIMPAGHKCIGIQTLEDCAGCNDNQTVPVRQVICHKGNFPCTKNFDTQHIADQILAALNGQ